MTLCEGDVAHGRADEGQHLHTHLEDQDDERVCWICLGGDDESGHLVQPCACPRYTHASCLARWQLVSAGKNEESRCRFCDKVLPDWRPALTPTALQPKPSVMSVRYRGVTHRIQYTPGPDGLESFLNTLQSIGIKVASASQVTFLCRSPDTGEEMALRGLKAFDAAAYCASITAAKRIQRNLSRRRSSGAASDAAGDMGVHAAHPESPTAAGAARRCEEGGAVRAEASGGGGASGGSSDAEEGPPRSTAAAVSADGGMVAASEQLPLRQRVVAHVHAEALQEGAGAQASAVPAPRSAAAAEESSAALPSDRRRSSAASSSSGRSRRSRRGTHSQLWNVAASLVAMVVGGRRQQ